MTWKLVYFFHQCECVGIFWANTIEMKSVQVFPLQVLCLITASHTVTSHLFNR